MSVALIFMGGCERARGDVAGSRQTADQAQREFLAVVLDGRVSGIDAPAHEQFGSISPRELRP